jgi:hypothetical protein
MSTEDLATDEHVRGRDMWVELDHPQRGKWFNVGMPIKLSASPAMIKRSPTLRRAHRDEFLKEVLDYDDAKSRTCKAGASRSPEEGRDEDRTSSASRISASRPRSLSRARRPGERGVLRAGEGRRAGPDSLRVAATEKGLKVHQLKSLQERPRRSRR